MNEDPLWCVVLNVVGAAALIFGVIALVHKKEK